MDQTKRILIHTANTLVPMSLIIVGVGSKDMTGMTILDADDKSLSLRGVRAKRDIVQFVGEFWFHEFFSFFLFFPIADMKETQAAIIETSKYPVRFFHHDFSHIENYFEYWFCRKKGYTTYFCSAIIRNTVYSRVSSTGFLESDLDAKLKTDEFWFELRNSVKILNLKNLNWY